ncbi:MAG: hypothetical protein PHX00_06855, partial [Synergistaceae bacterium]|nr:hypothetical protein [Synergistaceae bacterium]
MSAKNFAVEELTVRQIHERMRQGTLSCKALTEEYIRRIDAYDQKGPSLNAVILVNPNAVKEAEQHDV